MKRELELLGPSNRSNGGENGDEQKKGIKPG